MSIAIAIAVRAPTFVSFDNFTYNIFLSVLKHEYQLFLLYAFMHKQTLVFTD